VAVPDARSSLGNTRHNCFHSLRNGNSLHILKLAKKIRHVLGILQRLETSHTANKNLATRKANVFVRNVANAGVAGSHAYECGKAERRPDARSQYERNKLRQVHAENNLAGSRRVLTRCGARGLKPTGKGAL
jgi:hypothetical protein